MHQAGSSAHGGSRGSADGSSMNEPSFNAGLAPLPGGSPAAPPDTTGGGGTAAQAGGRPAAANAATGAPGRSASLAVSSAFALISSANLPDSVAPLSASTRRGQRYYAAGANADAAVGVPTAASASSDASLARSPSGGQQPRSLRLPPSPHAHLLSAAEAPHPAGGVACGSEVHSSSSGRVQHVAAARTPLSRSKSGVGNSGHFVTTYASGGAAAARAAAVAGGVSGSPPAVFGWTASGAGGLADTDPAILASLEQQQLMQLMQHQQQYIQQLHQRQQLQQLQRQQHQEALMQGLSTSAFGAARRGARAAAANRASCAGSVASGGAAAGGTVAMARAGGVAAAVSAAHAGASARDIDVSVGGSVARRQSTCIGVGAAAYQHQQQAAAGAVASGMFGSRALHHSGVGGLPAGSLYATAAASIGGGGGGGGRRTRSVENLMLVSNGSDDFCSMESTAAAASARSKPLPPPQPGSHTVHFPMSRAAAAGAGGASADAPAVRSSVAMTSVRSAGLSSAAGFVLPRPDRDATGQASSRAAAWIPVGALSPTSGTAREALSMNGAGPASPRSSRGKNFLARSLARLTSLAKMGGGASGSTGPGAISGMGDGGTSSSNQQQRSGLHRSPALSDGQVMLSNELLSVMAGVTSVDQAKEASRTFGGNSVGAAAAAGAAAGTGLKVVAAAAAAAAGMALEPAHRHVSVSWNHLTRAASGPLGAATLEVPQQPPPELWTFTPPAAKNSGSSGNMPMSSPRTAASGKGAAARNFGNSFNASTGHGVGSVSDLTAVVSGKLSVPVSALSAAGRQRPVLNTAPLMAAAAVDPFAGVALDAVDGPVADVASKSPRVIASPLPQHLSIATAAACPSPAAMFRGSSGGAGGGGGGGHTSPPPLHLGSHPSPPPPTPPAAGLAVPRIVQLTMRSMARAGGAGVTGGTSALGGARWAASNGTGGGNSTNHASGPLSSLAAAALLESVGDRMPSALMHTYATGLCDDALGVGSATGGLAGAPVAGRFMSSSNVINRSAFHTCGDVVILEAAAAAAGGEEDAAAVADLVADVSIRGGIHGSVGASPRAGASAGLSGSFGSALHGHAGSSAVLMPPVIASSAGILTTTASCNSNQHVMLQHQSGHSALGALSTTAAGLGRLERSSAATLMQQQDLQQHQQQAADGANSRSCSPQKDGRDAETQLLAGHSGSWRNSCRAGGGGGGGGMGEATGGQDSGAQQTGGTMRSFASTPEAVGGADGSPAHAVDVRGAQDGRASRRRRQVDHGSGGGGGGGGGTLAVSSYASAGAGAGAAAAAASGLLSAEMLTAGAAAGNGRGGGKMAGMLVVTRCGSHSATSTASAAMSTVALPPPPGLQLATDTAAASFSVDTAAGGGGAADATAAVGSVLGGGAGGLGTEGGSWYELTVSAVPHPTSPGEFLIMVVQHDVSARVWAERQLARVVEAEHALLEAIFPAHVLEHIAVATMDAALTGGGAARTGPATQQQGSGADSVGAPVAAVSGPLHITGDTFIHLATNHSMITVLFCDIQGFTGMCNSVRPGVVMAFLNDLFTRLDALLDAFGVYKVETIGDCYMVAGGLMKVDEETGAVTVRSDDVDPLHAYRTVQFAKALLQAAGAVRLPTTGEPVRLRVGIHSGSAMSGVVGTRMPRFCLFGDTVNTASRMESTGEAGAIHVSKAVFDLVPGEEWEPTGGVQAKGKGQLETYLLRPAMEDHGDAEATVPKL